MSATTALKIPLAPRERQLLEALADGSTLAAAAEHIGLREMTAKGYLQHAKEKLGGMRRTAAAIATAYATKSITPPDLLDVEGLCISREQRVLVPLVVRGERTAEIAAAVRRPAALVSEDIRGLMAALGARNSAHLAKLAWQYRLLTREEVLAWKL
ncbi:LuxR C-terminal-related transcriptional regulator [Streptomyces kanasensis]|uniref:LuxR C-terminal-related transcriptional regulator n=1 Tax=Streptomyces kanasensis TaxID=936756 RepID=UPI003700FA20